MLNINFVVVISYPSRKVGRGHSDRKIFSNLKEAISFIYDNKNVIGSKEDESFDPTYISLEIKGKVNAEIWDSRYDDEAKLNKFLATGIFSRWGDGRAVSSKMWISPEGEITDLSGYTPYALNKFLKMKGIK